MAYYNTIFNNLLQLIPRHQFQKVVNEYNGDKYVKKLTCWNQLTTLMFAQAKGKESLRDIETSLKAQSPKLYHLGLPVIKRSTLSDANNKREYRIFEELFYSLYERCRDLSPKHKFRFKNELYSIDATTIDLCLTVFPWAKFRKRKGAIKMHTMLNHNGCIPCAIVVSDGKKSDIKAAKEGAYPIKPDSIYIMDKGYVDFQWLWDIKEVGGYYVTRLKNNACYEVTGQHKPLINKGVREDVFIKMTGVNTSKKYPDKLRLVRYYDEEKDKEYIFITNLFHLSAKTIAQIYKARWKIELFFKWIKQNLKIKSFLGTTKNAVMTQIWVAMSYFLLLAYVKYKTKCDYSILELCRLIGETLLERMQLIDLLRIDPANPPRAPNNENQLTFSFV